MQVRLCAGHASAMTSTLVPDSFSVSRTPTTSSDRTWEEVVVNTYGLLWALLTYGKQWCHMMSYGVVWCHSVGPATSMWPLCSPGTRRAGNGFVSKSCTPVHTKIAHIYGCSYPQNMDKFGTTIIKHIFNIIQLLLNRHRWCLNSPKYGNS